MDVFYLLSIIIKIHKFVKSNSDKNNYVYDVKFITTYTSYYNTRFRCWGYPKKAPKGAFFH